MLSILGAVSAIPVVFQIVKRTWNFLYETFSFKHLKLRATGRALYSGTPRVTIKIALTGHEDIIVDEVAVQSRLSYPRRIEGALAWVRLGIGYFLDDVEGLSNVIGRSFPTITWIPTFPFHRISNPYIRKPLNVILGLVVFYYVILFLVPPFWPLLFVGPYWELKLFSGNENVRLSDKDSKAELERPFIIKPGVESSFAVSYKPSLYITSIFMTKLFIESTKILFVKEPPRIRRIRLPRNSEFTWKVTDILRVKLSGKMNWYSVKLGTGCANVGYAPD